MLGERLHDYDLKLCAYVLDNIAEHMVLKAKTKNTAQETDEAEDEPVIPPETPVKFIRSRYYRRVQANLARQPLLLRYLEQDHPWYCTLDELPPGFTDAEIQQLAQHLPAKRFHLLLSTEELLCLESAVEGDLDRHWEPDEELHRSYVQTVQEVRDNLSRQAVEDWSEDCKRFGTRLEEDGVRVSDGIVAIREWTGRLRALLRAMGAVELLPVPEGRSPTPTHPTLASLPPSAPSARPNAPMAVPLSTVEAAPSVDGESGVKGSSTQKPAEPTRAYCLLPPNLVQWEGSIEVQQRLWHLLGVLLDKGGQASAEVIEEAVSPHKERADKALYNDVSALNKQLERIKWPFTYRCKSGFVVADPSARS